tara:strand:+ start:2708 stop:2956 length:249 start_codon:yes stop_codon:yes gene_type:complete
MNIEYDNIISKMIEKHKIIPKIFIIGSSKSASSFLFSEIKNSIKYHNFIVFQDIYDTKVFENNNYNFYKFIIYLGKKFFLNQ